jgi:hypothetical protein
MRDLVLKPGVTLPGWKEAFRSAWQNQSPDKMFASNRAFCKECRQPLWIGTSGREGRGEHEHKPVPWGPQQVSSLCALDKEANTMNQDLKQFALGHCESQIHLMVHLVYCESQIVV